MLNQDYLLYVIIAALTISSPGPGVVLTITNTITNGFKFAVPGMIGIALGMFLISVLAASGIGILVTSSPFAYSVLKCLGAFYLFYLGYKLWKSSPVIDFNSEHIRSHSPIIKRLREGFFITLLNPKPIVFFLALFPQFINSNVDYFLQFSVLTGTFCVLILVIHCLYAGFANHIRKCLKEGAAEKVNKISSLCFWGFSVALLAKN